MLCVGGLLMVLDSGIIYFWEMADSKHLLTIHLHINLYKIF